MKFEDLLNLVEDDPVFETALLLAGNANPAMVRLQLTRWAKSGRIYQLRRGLYALAPPYQKVKPHPFVIANHLRHASYVSLQTALAYDGLIPEVLQTTTSVTTNRPERLSTALGDYEFRHIRTDLLYGYRMLDLRGQQALVAWPEKALLDLVYLQPGADDLNYLHELRLQNLERLDLERLNDYAGRFASPKISRAAEAIAHIAQSEAQAYEDLP